MNIRITGDSNCHQEPIGSTHKVLETGDLGERVLITSTSDGYGHGRVLVESKDYIIYNASVSLSKHLLTKNK